MFNRIETKLIRILQSIAYFMVWTTKFLVFSLFLRVKVEGRENVPKKGRFILAGNHQNFFDGFFLVYAIGPFKKVSFLIARRSLKLKLFQIIAGSIGSVLIGNEIEEYQKALKKLNRILSHGGLVGIFPEGDVSKHSLPRKFKGGVAKLSLDSKTKVIPIYLKGTYNLRYSWYWLKRPEISIKIGKPVDLYNYAGQFGNNLEQMAMLLRERIIELVNLNEEILSSSNIKPLVNVSDLKVREVAVNAKTKESVIEKVAY